jgi:hypothetical protein
MGYRSEGLWLIRGEPDMVRAAWTAVRLSVPDTGDAESSKNALDSFMMFERDGKGYIRLEYSGWKWYESYSDVQYYERIWAYLAEHYADSLSGVRMRIGEDEGDNERLTFGDGFLDIYLQRNIADDEPGSGDPLFKQNETEVGDELPTGV